MEDNFKQKGLFRIQVYADEDTITAMAKESEKAGFRRVGLPIRTIKEHGFSGEWVANLDGIAPFLKFCYKYYIKAEPERLEAKAKLQREIEEKKKALEGLK